MVLIHVRSQSLISEFCYEVCSRYKFYYRSGLGAQKTEYSKKNITVSTLSPVHCDGNIYICALYTYIIHRSQSTDVRALFRSRMLAGLHLSWCRTESNYRNFMKWNVLQRKKISTKGNSISCGIQVKCMKYSVSASCVP